MYPKSIIVQQNEKLVGLVYPGFRRRFRTRPEE